MGFSKGGLKVLDSVHTNHDRKEITVKLSEDKKVRINIKPRLMSNAEIEEKRISAYEYVL
ncbi:MAG: hypothetical protein WDZ35_01890 [Crocinitomicaceae bacterium]